MLEPFQNISLFKILSTLLLISFLGLQSCSVSKFLEEDEHVISNIRMTLDGPPKVLDNSELREELQKLYKIKPNNNRKSYFYYKYKDIENPKWPKKWIKNKQSEPPSLINEKEIIESALSIQQYLQNKKGFYQAVVDYEVDYRSEGKANVNFLVSTGERYVINELHHISRDTTLAELINQISKNSLLRSGDPIDAFTFDLEKQRIVSDLQKQGYADFNLTNVEIQGDSTELDKAWDIFVTILPQQGTKPHQAYKIGDINVYTDYHQFQQVDNLESESKYDKVYSKESQEYVVRPSIINKKIFLDKYSTYSTDNYYKTLRKLYQLSAYSFAKLNTEVNETDPSLIDYNIFLTPHNSKWILDLGLESFFSTLSAVDDQLVGFAASTGIEDRNMFGGSVRFKATVQAGVEFNPTGIEDGSQQGFISTRSLGLNSEFEIPTLTKPLNVLRPLNKFGLIKDNQMRVLEEEGVSHLRIGINFLDILRFYTNFSRNVSYGYDFSINKKNSISFNQAGINYTTYSIDSLFFPIIDANPVLENSFVDNLFTGLIFKDLTYSHTTERGPNKSNFAFISYLETSGLEVHLANSVSNLITDRSADWQLNGNTEFEKMVKMEFDAIWYSRKKRLGQLVARFKTGVAIPFGTDSTISYIKQFFIGGPSSVRAWRPMQLGPGSFVNSEFFFPTSSTIFFQRGDFNLEMNLEYRFNIISLLEGALFVDVGNIWTLRNDPVRPGSQLSSSFLDELAIGYGYGFRFDFTYFLIRFDLGLKLRFPSNEFSTPSGPQIRPPNRWIGPSGQSFGNFNIAVAYPF